MDLDLISDTVTVDRTITQSVTVDRTITQSVM